jgi:hypothetical protein
VKRETCGRGRPEVEALGDPVVPRAGRGVRAARDSAGHGTAEKIVIDLFDVPTDVCPRSSRLGSRSPSRTIHAAFRMPMLRDPHRDGPRLAPCRSCGATT